MWYSKRTNSFIPKTGMKRYQLDNTIIIHINIKFKPFEGKAQTIVQWAQLVLHLGKVFKYFEQFLIVFLIELYGVLSCKRKWEIVLRADNLTLLDGYHCTRGRHIRFVHIAPCTGEN